MTFTPWDHLIHRFDSNFPSREDLFTDFGKSDVPPKQGDFVAFRGIEKAAVLKSDIEQLTSQIKDTDDFWKQYHILLPRFKVAEETLTYYERGYIDGIFNYKLSMGRICRDEEYRLDEVSRILRDYYAHRKLSRKDYLQGWRDGKGDRWVNDIDTPSKAVYFLTY